MRYAYQKLTDATSASSLFRQFDSPLDAVENCDVDDECKMVDGSKAVYDDTTSARIGSTVYRKTGAVLNGAYTGVSIENTPMFNIPAGSIGVDANGNGTNDFTTMVAFRKPPLTRIPAAYFKAPPSWYDDNKSLFDADKVSTIVMIHSVTDDATVITPQMFDDTSLVSVHMLESPSIMLHTLGFTGKCALRMYIACDVPKGVYTFELTAPESSINVFANTQLVARKQWDDVGLFSVEIDTTLATSTSLSFYIEAIVNADAQVITDSDWLTSLWEFITSKPSSIEIPFAPMLTLIGATETTSLADFAVNNPYNTGTIRMMESDLLSKCTAGDVLKTRTCLKGMTSETIRTMLSNMFGDTVENTSDNKMLMHMLFTYPEVFASDVRERMRNDVLTWTADTLTSEDTIGANEPTLVFLLPYIYNELLNNESIKSMLQRNEVLDYCKTHAGSFCKIVLSDDNEYAQRLLCELNNSCPVVHTEVDAEAAAAKCSSTVNDVVTWNGLPECDKMITDGGVIADRLIVDKVSSMRTQLQTLANAKPPLMDYALNDYIPNHNLDEIDTNVMSNQLVDGCSTHLSTDCVDVSNAVLARAAQLGGSSESATVVKGVQHKMSCAKDPTVESCDDVWNTDNVGIYLDIVEDYCGRNVFDTKCIDYYNKVKQQSSPFVGSRDTSITWLFILLLVVISMLTIVGILWRRRVLTHTPSMNSSPENT